MPAKVELADGSILEIRHGQWSAPDEPELAQFYNLMAPPGGASGADPDPDLNAALQLVRERGGRIIAHEPLHVDKDDSLFAY